MMDDITKSFLCGKMYDDIGHIRTILKTLRKYPASDELKAAMHTAHESLEKSEYELLKVKEAAGNRWEPDVG